MDAEARVGRERRLDRRGTLECDVGARDPVEQAFTRSEEDRRDRERELVDESGREVLAEQVGAPMTMTFLPAAAASGERRLMG